MRADLMKCDKMGRVECERVGCVRQKSDKKQGSKKLVKARLIHDDRISE